MKKINFIKRNKRGGNKKNKIIFNAVCYKWSMLHNASCCYKKTGRA